jgi:hypothetical protein
MQEFSNTKMKAGLRIAVINTKKAGQDIPERLFH